MNWVIVFYILIWYIDFGNLILAKFDKSRIEKEEKEVTKENQVNEVEKEKKALTELLDESKKRLSQFQNLFENRANNKMADSNNSILFEKLSTGAANLGTKLQEAYTRITWPSAPFDNEKKKLWDREIATAKDQISSAAGVLHGLVSIFKGVHKKDLLGVVTGTLNTISSILMFTGPAGVIAGSVISLVSFTLSAIFAKEQKSESQVILDGVKSILEEYKDENLETYTENYFSVLNYKQEKIDEFLLMKENRKEDIELIKIFIGKSADDVFSKDEKIRISVNTAMRKYCRSLDKCSNCLAKLQHYLIVSLQSEMFARQLAGLGHGIAIAHQSSYFDSTLNLLDRAIGKLHEKRQNLMNYLLVASTNDNEFKWNCIAEYYKYPGKFENIDLFFKYYANQPVLESEESLIVIWERVNFTGRHATFTTKGNKIIDYKASNWTSKFKLIFVPRKYEVVLRYDEAKEQELFIKIYGPTLIEVPDVTFKILVFNYNEQFSGEYFRICKEAKMGGPCFQIDTKDLNDKYNVAKDMFPAKSLYIPSGWNVDIYGEKEALLTDYKTFENKGPLLLENICEVYKITNLSKFFYQNPSENRAKICSQEYFGGWCSYIEANTMISYNTIHSCEWKNIKSYAIPMYWKLEVKTSDEINAFDLTGVDRTSIISKIISISFELDAPLNIKKKIKRRKEKSRRKERKN